MQLLIRCTVLGMLVYAAWVPTAHACAPEGCAPPIRVFPLASSAGVPGNLVYFKVLRDDPGPLSLRVKGGDVIPSSIRMIGKDRVFAPNAPIAAGTEVQLDYSLYCGQDSTPTSFVFKTYESVDVTLREAELEIESLGIAYPNSPHNEAGFVQLQYYSPENGDAYYLVDRTVTIDGMPAEIDSQGRIKVSSSCNPAMNKYLSDTCGRTRNVPLGEHTVEVRTSIVGQASDPPPTRITVRTECSIRCAAPGNATDAGTSSGQAASDAAPASIDAGSKAAVELTAGRASDALEEPAMASAKPRADLHEEKAPSLSEAKGCSIGSGAPSRLPAWSLLLSLAVWSIARRKRSSRLQNTD